MNQQSPSPNDVVADPRFLASLQGTARRLRRQPQLRNRDLDDLKQDLLVEVLIRMRLHDPSRGNPMGLAITALSSGAASVARSARRLKRDPRRSTRLVDAHIDGQLPAEAKRRRCRHDTTTDWGLRLDVLSASAGLPARDRAAIELLKTYGPTEVRKRLGMGRGAGSRTLRRMRLALRALDPNRREGAD